MKETVADFWMRMNGGVWRTCTKKPFICRGHFYLSDDTRVSFQHHVGLGDRYFDTNEADDRGYMTTTRICAYCAHQHLDADACLMTQ